MSLVENSVEEKELWGPNLALKIKHVTDLGAPRRVWVTKDNLDSLIASFWLWTLKLVTLICLILTCLQKYYPKGRY